MGIGPELSRKDKQYYNLTDDYIQILNQIYSEEELTVIKCKIFSEKSLKSVLYIFPNRYLSTTMKLKRVRNMLMKTYVL